MDRRDFETPMQRRDADMPVGNHADEAPGEGHGYEALRGGSGEGALVFDPASVSGAAPMASGVASGAYSAVSAASGAAPAAPRAADGSLPAMEVRDVAFSYGKNKVLEGVSLLVEQGKVTCVLGPNGCGKSTLFALMTKNLAPSRGKVFLRGKNIAVMGLKDFARRVSIVHQNNTAADDMTVEQLVELGRAPYRKPMTALDAEDERLVDWALEVTGSAPYRERELARLSGGQRQRVWIAMALAQNTDILFLDEPTTYLDVRYQVEILELVRQLNREFGITIVMVLHDINQALAYSDVVVGLKDGHVAFSGAPGAMVTRESMRDLFGVDLEVLESHGVKHVLLKGADPVTGPGERAGESVRENAGARAGDGMQAGADLQAGRNLREGGDAIPDVVVSAGLPAAATSAVDEPVAAARPYGDATSGASPAPSSSQAGNRNAPVEPGNLASTYPAGTAEGPVPAWAPDYAKVQDQGRIAGGAAAGDAQSEQSDADPGRSEPEQSRNRVARALWTALGVITFGLGTVGTVLPILPTVPLYLAALFCFAKGSQRLHDWFVNTNLYHKHLESFVDHRGMTMRTKLSIIGTVTVVMGIAFALMGRVPVGRVVLVIVWVAHVIFFLGFVKTEKPGDDGEDGEGKSGSGEANGGAGSPRPVPAWAPDDATSGSYPG